MPINSAQIAVAAQRAVAAGMSVIPLTKKKPLGEWTEYQSRQPTAAELRAWFGNGAARNLGVVCGGVSGNLLLIDFDEARFYDAWAARVAPLADGLVLQRTGSGMMHVILRSDAPVSGNLHLAWAPDETALTGRRIAIETRGEGGQFVIAPSVHPDTGRAYEFIRGDLESVPVVPAALVEFLLDAARKLDEAPLTRQELEAIARRAQSARMHRPTPAPGESVIDAYNRTMPIRQALEQRGYTAHGERYIRPGGGRPLVSILEGERSYHHSSEDGLSDGKAHDAFDVFAFYEHGNDTEAAVKAAAGLLGMSAPTSTTPKQKPAPVGVAVEEKSGKAVVPTHDELRDRWLAKYPDTVYGLGQWHRYSAGVWQPVDDGLIEEEIQAQIEVAKFDGVKPTSAILSSVSKLARVRCWIKGTRFDADADLLVCQNGTLHIPTLALREHNPAHWLTTGVSYDYDPAASAPTWEYFLKSTLAPDVVDFLQEFSGYALTTDCSLETAVWLYGPRGSGKSTFLEGLEAMLGERAGLLGLADIERSRFALGNIPGKTLLVAKEQPATFISSTHILNSMISGETITLERKFSDPFEIRPRAKIAWAMNDLPRVAESSNGLFRRVKVVLFANRPAEEIVPDVKEKIRREGAGILNWALVGLGRLREHGRFEVPASIVDATAHFQESNDIPAMFLREGGVLLGSELKAQAASLYKFYREWCMDSGHKSQSSTTIAADWERLGLERRRSAGVAYWHGVGLPAARDMML